MDCLPWREHINGDYFDIIETHNGKFWVGIGDVSGHGVESGLIMMMAQTSIATAINMNNAVKPSQVLNEVNHIIKENISRLEVDRYMTLSLFQLESSYIVTAGRHQDLFIYRFNTRQLEKVMVKGTWIGVMEDISDSNTDVIVPIGRDDVIFLFTDGVTEAANASREMFGTGRLTQLFQKYAEYPVEQIVTKVYEEVKNFQKTQADDISIVILRNTYKWYSSKTNILDKIKAGSVLWRAN